MTLDRDTTVMINAAVRNAIESMGLNTIRRSEFFGLNERTILLQKAA